MQKSIQLVGFWEVEGKSGNSFFASNKITFGELRALLKGFKEDQGVEDDDNIEFFLFQSKSDHAKAPTFHLTLKKNDYKKESK